MKGTILITDTLFILKEHEEKIRAAGYEIERLETPTATEKELIEHIKGKIGYVLGGIEHVTDSVIEAADSLRAIAFTGADWRHYIPGHRLATEKHIAIANTPGANSVTVAEFTLLIMLAMTRNIFALARTGPKRFQTTHSLSELKVGIVGMGRIGLRMAYVLRSLGVDEILYTSRQRKPEIERPTGSRFVDIKTLLSESDVITLHASQDAGTGYIGAKELALMKDGALLVNCGFTGSIDKDALFSELKSGRIRAFQDDPMDERFNELPLDIWMNSNLHMAYNTFEANKLASDMATQSLINLLEIGRDQYRVN